MPEVRFRFDLNSPYAYLASERTGELVAGLCVGEEQLWGDDSLEDAAALL
jgi:2-hydroxychromene-2-carboxylate isomerase